MSDGEALLRWYVALSAVTLLAAPAVIWLGAGLGAARHALLRAVGLAIAAALVWWPAVAFGLPFTRAIVIGALLFAGTAAWVAWWRAGFRGINVAAILAFEGVWLAAFAGYALMRSYNPDIANTEKPMEIALLSAISRSSDVPAPDPWLAGASINYYYFGYQSIATVVKLSGVPSTIAFNMALATLFASCVTVAAGIGLALARVAGVRRGLALAAAALAPLLLVLTSNLETARRLVRDFDGTVRAGWWDGVGWQASRIIVDTGVHGNPDPRPTINEFPAFSFVLGDLHPHVLSYALFASVLALAIGVATSEAGRGGPRLAAIGALVGLLYASNSWDAPAGLLFVIGGVWLASRNDWRAALGSSLWVVVGAAAAAAPFVLTFNAPVGVDNPDVPSWLSSIPIVGTVFNTFGIVDWKPSSISELVIVHGLWMATFLVWFVAVARGERRTRVLLARHRDMLLISVSLSFALAIIWMPALVLIGWPCAAALWIALTFARPADRLVGGLYAIGYLLVLVPEFFYIQDVFADRMNTVFKLYFQAWLVLSMAAVGSLVRAWQVANTAARVALGLGTVGLLIVALPYSAISAWDWNSGFATRHGLDGSAYIRRANSGDDAVIAWIREHADADDTIVEAPGCSYVGFAGVPLSRVSAFTGVPTLIGWNGRESQWRRGDERWLTLLGPRVEEANALLSATQPASADESAPRFLILGKQELEENPGCSHSVARDEDIVVRLERAGWLEAFEYEGTSVFVRSTDPLTRQSLNAVDAVSSKQR